MECSRPEDVGREGVGPEDVGRATDPARLFDLGNTLSRRGETEAAIAAFRRCLAAAPGHAATWFNLANMLLQAGRPMEAVDGFVACLRVAPDFGRAYVNLAETLRRLGLLEQAQWAAEHGVRHLPGRAEAWICLGNTRHDVSDYARAIAAYRQVLDLVPDHAGALTSLGNSLHAMGCLDEAVTVLERAVAAAPEDANCHFNLATALLAAGDFARGWGEYEWRWHRSQARPRGFGPAWRGQAVAGQSILLHAEQGLGDTLQFVRYAPLVAEQGVRVVLEVQPPLVRLLRALPGVERVIAYGDPLPAFDAHCPLLSLPLALATQTETIPVRMPYLQADPLAVARWRTRLPDDGRPLIGLVWAGSSHDDDAGARLIDRRRSLPIGDLGIFAGLTDVHFISLQKREVGQNDLPSGLTLIDPMADVMDFADTAALIGNLDLVVSADTSVAHLAGGMGQPVWLLSRYDGCWRWLHDRNDSPWYPSMRIYRQRRPHGWAEVLARVRRDLADPASRARFRQHNVASRS